MLKKYDFIALISVNNANPNGDPNMAGRPRQDADGYGIISDVCLKHKLRNRMLDAGATILYVSDDRATDGMTSVQQRVNAMPDADGMTLAERVCMQYTDVRAMGAVLAYKNKDKEKDSKVKAKRKQEDEDASDMGENTPGSVSCKVRGPLTLQMGMSVDPIVIEELQITKSLNGSEAEKEGEMTSDRMGWKTYVPFGLYVVKGSINPLLAEKTGLSEDDVEMIKQGLATLFENDESASRPAGSMTVEKLVWWTHPGQNGATSSGALYRTVSVENKNPDKAPTSYADYDVRVDSESAKKLGIEVEEFAPLTGWVKD